MPDLASHTAKELYLTPPQRVSSPAQIAFYGDHFGILHASEYEECLPIYLETHPQ
jgi:hypothetical protein